MEKYTCKNCKQLVEPESFEETDVVVEVYHSFTETKESSKGLLKGYQCPVCGCEISPDDI